MTFPLFIVPQLRESISLPETPSTNGDGSSSLAGTEAVLPAGVYQHAVKAMRLGNNDTLWLSDGMGLKVRAVITDISEGMVRIEGQSYEPAPQIRLGLIQALAKSGRDEQAVEMAVEIGADAVIPWQADRSIVQWKGPRAAKGREKWHDRLVMAAEQSRRSRVPELGQLMVTKQLVPWAAGQVQSGNAVIVLHQEAADTWGDISRTLLGQYARTMDDGAAHDAGGSASAPRYIYIAAGPEGGISSSEIEQLRSAGAYITLLGRNILRASSAGPVALALLSEAFGRFSAGRQGPI